MDDDLYSAVSVHGLWPVVRDPSAPSGIRFAVLGDDAPEDCIRDAADLPPAEMTLHLFGKANDIAPWAAAAREFGGNTVSVVLPDERLLLPCALVLRHDRARRRGVTVNEQIDLRDVLSMGPVTDERLRQTKLIFAERQRRAMENRREGAVDDAWRKSWSAEIDFIKATKGLDFNSHGAARTLDEPLQFSRVDHQGFRTTSFTLVNINGSKKLGAYINLPALEADLRQEWYRERAELGFDAAPRGLLVMPCDHLDEQTITKVEEAWRKALDVKHHLEGIQAARQCVASVIADQPMMKLLRRTREGCLVLGHRQGAPCAQLSVRSGTPQAVSWSLLSKALKSGMMAPVWLVNRDEFSLIAAPSFYGLTEAGRLLMDGGDTAAKIVADTVDEPQKQGELKYSRDDLLPSLAAIGASLSPEATADLRTAVREALPKEDDFNIKEFCRHRSRYEAWAIIAGALATGLLTKGSSKDMLRRADDNAEEVAAPQP